MTGHANRSVTCWAASGVVSGKRVSRQEVQHRLLGVRDAGIKQKSYPYQNNYPAMETRMVLTGLPRDHCMWQKNINDFDRVVAIGGGHGMGRVLSSLSFLGSRLTGIVTTTG